MPKPITSICITLFIVTLSTCQTFQVTTYQYNLLDPVQCLNATGEAFNVSVGDCFTLPNTGAALIQYNYTSGAYDLVLYYAGKSCTPTAIMPVLHYYNVTSVCHVNVLTLRSYGYTLVSPTNTTTPTPAPTLLPPMSQFPIPSYSVTYYPYDPILNPQATECDRSLGISQFLYNVTANQCFEIQYTGNSFMIIYNTTLQGYILQTYTDQPCTEANKAPWLAGNPSYYYPVDGACVANGYLAVSFLFQLLPFPPTPPPTPPPTLPPTSPPTPPPTKPPTKPPTHPPTKPPTHPPTKPPTHPPTKPPTKPPTNPPPPPPPPPPSTSPATHLLPSFLGTAIIYLFVI